MAVPCTSTDALRGIGASIADALAETAIGPPGRCTWLSATVDGSPNERCVVHRTGDPFVYQGDAGISWALGYAAKALKRPDLGEIARAGASGAVQRAGGEEHCGLHDGASGVAIAGLQVGTTLADPKLVAAALDLLEAATAMAPRDHDVVGGCGGVIVALLAAHADTADDKWLSPAEALGRELIERAERYPWGWAWASRDAVEPPLCGLAHGAAGVAWALSELEARLGHGEFGNAAREGLRYERSWFDRRRSNWPDLRNEVGGPRGCRAFPAWWCHGSVGGGLVRLRLKALGLDEPIVLAEACAALQSSFTDAARSIDDGRLQGHGLTVCHGLGGSVELFLIAHALLGEEEHLATAHWLLDRATAVLGPDVEQWPDGVGSGAASPGLMTGMAGTLLLFLRAAGIAGVPSVGLFPLG
jgi:lantibiotic modifying enzyme